MLKTPCKDHGNRLGVDTYDNGRHVQALIDYTGEQPNGRFALHNCDNKRCIEGSHLYWGSPQQNMLDKVKRGRWKGGAPRHLSDDQVRHIRSAFAAGASKASLGRLYNKSPGVIFQIIEGITYRGVQ